MSRAAGLWTTALLALGTPGCSGDAPVSNVASQDSAGIAIVVSAAGAGQGVIHVAAVPRMRLGDDGATEFYRVADATRSSDGSLVVLDGASREVRFFDRDGRLVTAAGGEGEGPGEFDRFASVSPFRGDSVLVYDNWLRRATIYDAHGSLGRVLSLPPELQAQDVVPFGEDELLAVTWSLDAFMELEGPYRLPYTVLRLSATGTVRDTVFAMPGPGGYKVSRGGGDYTDFAPLVIQDGHLSSREGEAVFGSAERWEIRRMGLDGVVTQILRVPSLERPITAAEVDRERSAMLRPGARAEYRDIVRELEHPDQWPAYGDLLLASNGWVWAAEYRSLRTELDAPTKWVVFDESGAWVGVGTTPPRFDAFEIGADYLLGVRRDEHDVEHVEVLEWALRPSM